MTDDSTPADAYRGRRTRRRGLMSSHASAVPRQAPEASVPCAAPVADLAAAAQAINDSPPLPAGHHPVLSRAWPLRDAIELGPVPAAVRRARQRSRQMLRDWGLSKLIADTELLVSELTTNAIAAVQSTLLVRMWLLADAERVLVLVWDPSPLPPVLAHSGLDAESGRGLQIVEAVSQLWDWYWPRDVTGKIVWALAGPARS
jgi:anti-sigma regulatory factor (Ser/Thr protein kinase)